MKEIIDFLLQSEGIRTKAYLCPAGRWTIGIGNTFYEDGTPVKAGDTITVERAYKLAEFVALDFLLHVKKCLKNPATKNQHTALVSLCYNVGKPAFAKSLVLGLINTGAPKEEIVKMWSRSFITANGVISHGLQNRRLIESKKYF